MHHNLSSAPHKRTHSKITLTGSLALQEMPGIGETSAQAILAVIGTDMSRFPTAGRLGCVLETMRVSENEKAEGQQKVIASYEKS